MDNKEVSLFKYHVNNIDETISSVDINNLAKAINNNQKNIINAYDTNFTNRTLFILENHLIVNACFIDELKNPYKIFQAKSNNIKFNEDESCIVLSDNMSEGTVQSTFFKPDDNAPIDELMIMVDDYIPKGAKILYFVSVNGNEFFPIKKNTSETFKLKDFGNGIFIRAKLIRNLKGESPKIFAWSALYRDKIIESLTGIKKIDFTDYSIGEIGDTIIVRDKNLEDRVVMVIEPDGYTELLYDFTHGGRLDFVLAHSSEKTIKEEMRYGEYLNHEDKIEEVLLGTRKHYVKNETFEKDLQEYIDGYEKIIKRGVKKNEDRRTK